MRATSFHLCLGLGALGLLPLACDMGSPGMPGSKLEDVEAGVSDEGGSSPEAATTSDSSGSEPTDASGSDAAEAAPVEPPPSGWLALVAGHGSFGQTYDDADWTTRIVASVDLYAVSCVTNLSGWVAGAGGFVAHTPDGGWSFSLESTPFTTDL